MPAMPRVPGKATKIAYKILGVPPNISYKRTEAQKEIDKQLIFEETIRVR